MRNVVTAVEVVVDKHFPVAMDVVSAPVKVAQFADAEGRDALDETAKKFGERRRLVVQVDEDEALPGFDPDRDEAVLRKIKILDAFELRHPLQGAIEAVVPAVVRTMQQRSLAAGLSYDGSGMVAADIVEAAQNAV